MGWGLAAQEAPVPVPRRRHLQLPVWRRRWSARRQVRKQTAHLTDRRPQVGSRVRLVFWQRPISLPESDGSSTRIGSHYFVPLKLDLSPTTIGWLFNWHFRDFMLLEIIHEDQKINCIIFIVFVGILDDCISVLTAHFHVRMFFYLLGNTSCNYFYRLSLAIFVDSSPLNTLLRLESF